MNRMFFAAFVTAGFCAASVSAQDPEEPVRLSLAQALAEAVHRNPLILASDDNVTAANGFVLQAGLKPNPRLVIQAENLRAWETPPAFNLGQGSDIYVYAGQIIERGHKREERISVAQAELDRAKKERDAERWRIQSRVAAAYWNASAAASIAALYRQDLNALDQIVEFNRVRVREGAAAGIDLVRVRIERERLSVTLHSAEDEARLARISLLREMGRSQFPKVILTDSLEQLPQPQIVSVDEVLRRRPDVQAAIAQVHQTQANAGLQAANAKTDPEVQLGYKRTYGLDTVYAAVSIPLPIRNRNQGNIAAAEAELNNARHVLEAVSNQVKAEYEAAKEAWLSKRTTFDQNVVPLRASTRGVSTISLAAYREGGVELLRVLDAERVRIETDVLYYRSLAELQQSAVNLRIAEGDEL